MYQVLLVSLTAGALLPIAYAPLSLVGSAFIALGLLYYLLNHYPHYATRIGYCFGMGYFLCGLHWLAICIHQYGHLPLLLAGVLCLLLVALLAVYCALVAFLFNRYFSQAHTLLRIAGFAGLWTMSEWLRAHCIIGLPWLQLGYIAVDSPLSALAPIVGVFGLSFVISSLSALLIEGLNHQLSPMRRTLLLSLFISSVLLPSYVIPTDWTTPTGKGLRLRLVQANVSEKDKWDDAFLVNLYRQYYQLSRLVQPIDLIVWPESSLPLLKSALTPLLRPLNQTLHQSHAALMLGLFDEKSTVAIPPSKIFNSLYLMGESVGHYYKRHLVPLGEALPFSFFAPIFHALNLPLPPFTAGPMKQPLPQYLGVHFAPSLCYDLAYSDGLLRDLPQGTMLASLTDDVWFGHSSALPQHLQIARMRSLQSGRAQFFASNNGLSSFINQHGMIIDSLPRNTTGVLEGYLKAYAGLTPWATWGDNLVMLCIAFITLLAYIVVLFTNKQRKPPV